MERKAKCSFLIKTGAVRKLNFLLALVTGAKNIAAECFWGAYALCS